MTVENCVNQVTGVQRASSVHKSTCELYVHAFRGMLLCICGAVLLIDHEMTRSDAPTFEVFVLVLED